MSIPQSFISQLVSMCDIQDVISSYVNIKTMGRNSKCVCPFHSEKTPSCVVYSDTQSFFCFGCGAGGDVISFIMRIENLGYVEAVQLLAKRVGLTVPEGVDDQTSKLRSIVLEINKEAARFFHRCLKSEIGKKGYEYFKSRGISDKIITTYGLGYAPDSWDLLKNHLRKKGYTYEQMYQAAIVSQSKQSNNYYDVFRNRVMFPIIDLRGNVIAFGGRVLDDSKPKYLNSADTVAFKKSRNLFSLNLAKNEIKDKLILAEGYMDVIAIYSAGLKNVVATLGTALTAEQARLISKYTNQVVIAYDSDNAGQAATQRAINLFSEVGVTTKTLNMVGAKDPDEFIKRFGVKRFELLIDGAENVIEFELKKLREKFDIETSDGKINYSKKAIGILANVKNPIEREVYANIVASDTGNSSETILSQANATIKRNIAKKEKQDWSNIQSGKVLAQDKINPQKSDNLREALAEENIIAFLFKNPDMCDDFCSKMSYDDFVTDFNKMLVKKIIELAKSGEDITLSNLCESLDIDQTSKVSGIIATRQDLSNSKFLLNDYIDILLQHKNKLTSDDIKNMTGDELEKIRQQLLQKKKK